MFISHWGMKNDTPPRVRCKMTFVMTMMINYHNLNETGEMGNALEQESSNHWSLIFYFIPIVPLPNYMYCTVSNQWFPLSFQSMGMSIFSPAARLSSPFLRRVLFLSQPNNSAYSRSDQLFSEVPVCPSIRCSWAHRADPCKWKRPQNSNCTKL